jgi:tRNA(Ile)-lysidine synthetase-like protein
LPVPGSVSVPGGWVFSTAPCPDLRPPTAGRSEGAPPLVVRTRRPGDRIHVGRREISLKRFLTQERVPFDLRGAVPFLASGARILWAPGLPNVVRHDAEPGPVEVVVSRAAYAQQRDV